ncbi:MAG TPA: hypothetical protein VGO61_00055 [Steroidobacteraceae bacterium]|nr:hypothetical protein [Steroidobacteraceae bacterium]
MNCCRGPYPEKVALLDHCFVPASWIKDRTRVKVAGNEEWKQHSDHRPVIVFLGGRSCCL